MTETNEFLRAHVTRVGFDLSLARSHIAALIYIEELRRARWDMARFDLRVPRSHPLSRAFAHFAGGASGLHERGLLVHTDTGKRIRWFRDDDGTDHAISPPGTWRITKAGRLVLDLLREAGIYEEYASAIRRPPSEAAS